MDLAEIKILYQQMEINIITLTMEYALKLCLQQFKITISKRDTNSAILQSYTKKEIASIHLHSTELKLYRPNLLNLGLIFAEHFKMAYN